MLCIYLENTNTEEKKKILFILTLDSAQSIHPPSHYRYLPKNIFASSHMLCIYLENTHREEKKKILKIFTLDSAQSIHLAPHYRSFRSCVCI